MEDLDEREFPAEGAAEQMLCGVLVLPGYVAYCPITSWLSTRRFIIHSLCGPGIRNLGPTGPDPPAQGLSPGYS